MVEDANGIGKHTERGDSRIRPFAVFPEITLLINNTQWKSIFKIVDYSDISASMVGEIIAWEKNRQGYILIHVTLQGILLL